MIRYQSCQDCGEHYQPPDHKCKEFTVLYADEEQKNPTYNASTHEDAALQWAIEHVGNIISSFLKQQKPRGSNALIPLLIEVQGPHPYGKTWVEISGRLSFGTTVDITLCSEIKDYKQNP